MCILRVALDVKMLSWFGPLLCTNHARVPRDYRHKGKSLKHGYRCAAVQLLPTVLILSLQYLAALFYRFVCAYNMPSHAPPTHTEARTRIHIFTEVLCVAITKEGGHSAASVVP